MSSQQCYFTIHNTNIPSIPFFAIPQFLFSDSQFSKLSLTAKVLYSLLLNRCSLSISNGWFDARGHAYIIFTVEEIKSVLDCSNDRAIKSIAELCSLDLVEKKKQGQGKPNILYVKYLVKSENPIKKIRTSADQKGRIKPSSSAGYKKKCSLSFSNHTSKNSFTKDSEIRNSRDPENRILEFRNTEGSKTENNKTNIISSFKDNQNQLNNLIDDIYMITDNLCKYPITNIKGKQVQSELIKEKIHKMDKQTISRILHDKVFPNISHISNLSPYVVSVLYNEPIISNLQYNSSSKKTYDILEFEKNSYFELPPDDW